VGGVLLDMLLLQLVLLPAVHHLMLLSCLQGGSRLVAVLGEVQGHHQQNVQNGQQLTRGPAG
jgi:hypothetical protein